MKRLFELEKLDVRECIGVSIRKKIKEGEESKNVKKEPEECIVISVMWR